MRNLLLFLFLTAGTASAQEGVYIRPLPDGTESLEFTDSHCIRRVDHPGSVARLQSDTVVGQNRGRFVLRPSKPEPDKLKPFSALYVVEMTGDWIEVYRDDQRYSRPDEPPDHPQPLQLRRSQRYWTVPAYHHLTELPTMPIPDRDELEKMLDSVRASLRAGAGAHAVDEEIEDLVIARGYNPWTSKPVLQKAQQQYESQDPRFKNKVQEFERWLGGEYP